MLRLKSVIYNLLKSVCLFRGAGSLFYSPKLLTGFVLSALLIALCAMPLSVANAKTVTLAWSPNDEPDLEGYVIYRNTNSPGPPYSYSDSVPEDELADPLHPEAKLTGLQEGKEYYIALTAYNTEGVESGFSEKVCATVVDNTIELCETSASSPATTSSIVGGGGSSGGCFISTSTHSPLDKNLVLYIMITATAIGLGTYRYKIRARKK